MEIKTVVKPALATLIMGFLAVPPLLAQWHRISNPVDSPLWWTLSEELSPEDLKRLWSDRSLSLARYDEAVEAGLEKPLTPEERKRLKFYVHQGLTPELAPMWSAFDDFARIHLDRRGVPDNAVPAELSQQGITPSGVDKIMVMAHGCADDHAVLMADLGPKQIEAQRLIWGRLKAERAGKIKGKPIMESVNERRYDVVAAVSGRPVEEIRELVDALADWEAGRRLMAACLPELRVQLSEADWKRFRRYLREEIIQPGGGLPFFEPAVREEGR